MTTDNIFMDGDANAKQSLTPVDHTAAMLYHSDRADKYMDERDALQIKYAACLAALKELIPIAEESIDTLNNYHNSLKPAQNDADDGYSRGVANSINLLHTLKDKHKSAIERAKLLRDGK